MAYRYTIDPSRSLAVIVLSGAVDGTELVEAGMAKLADERWQAGFDEIWDGRGITTLLLEPADLTAIKEMERYAERAGSGKTALLVESEVVYMAARLFSTMFRSGNRDFQVFHDPKEACDWVGVTALPAIPEA